MRRLVSIYLLGCVCFCGAAWLEFNFADWTARIIGPLRPAQYARALPAPARLEPAVPVGIRLNNYWNIKQPGRQEWWLGSVGVDEHGHAVFEDPAYGVRAAIQLLRNYQLRHEITTVEEIIGRWAPPEAGNPTAQYAHKVSRDAGLKPTDRIILFRANGEIHDMDLLRRLMFSMAEFECGAGFAPQETQFQRGVTLYQS